MRKVNPARIYQSVERHLCAQSEHTVSDLHFATLRAANNSNSRTAHPTWQLNHINISILDKGRHFLLLSARYHLQSIFPNRKFTESIVKWIEMKYIIKWGWALGGCSKTCIANSRRLGVHFSAAPRSHLGQQKWKSAIRMRIKIILYIAAIIFLPSSPCWSTFSTLAVRLFAELIAIYSVRVIHLRRCSAQQTAEESCNVRRREAEWRNVRNGGAPRAQRNENRVTSSTFIYHLKLLNGARS